MAISDIKKPDTLIENSNLTMEVDTSENNNLDSFYSNQERNVKASDSGFVDNAIGFGLSFRELNGASNIWDWLEFDSGATMEELSNQENKSFMDNWKPADVNAYSDKAGIPQSYAQRLSRAKSPESLQSITEGVKQDMNNKQFINDHITRGWQTAGSITGAILDLDIAVPASKIAKISKVIEMGTNTARMGTGAVKIPTTLQAVKTPLALQAAWETSHAMVNDDYTQADAILGVAGMALVVAPLAKFQINKLNSNASKYSNTTASTNPIAWSRVNKTNKRTNVATGKDYPDSRFMNKNVKPATTEEAVESYLQSYTFTKNKDGSIDIPEPSPTVFNSQMADMFASIIKEPMKRVDDLVEEIVTMLSTKLDDMEVDSVPTIKEINAIMKIIRKEDPNIALKVEELAGIKLHKNPDGTYSMKTKGGVSLGKKIGATMGGALLLASTAEASEGEAINFQNIGLTILGIALTGVGGYNAWKAFKASDGNIAKIVSDIRGDIRKSQQSVNNATSNKAVGAVRDSTALVRTRLTETYQRFADFGGHAKVMADKLLVNVMDGFNNVAELASRSVSRRAIAKVMATEDEQYQLWLKEKGIRYQPIVNMFENNQHLAQFRLEVSDVIDGGVGGRVITPQARVVAKEVEKQMKFIYGEKVDANVAGYGKIDMGDGTFKDGIKYTKDYLPRYWQTNNVRSFIAGNSRNHDVIRNAIAQMAYPPLMKKYAKDLEAWKVGGKKGKEPKQPTMKDAELGAETILKHNNGEDLGQSKRFNDNSVARLEKQFDEQGIELTDAMKKTLTLESDKGARAMYRIDLDYTQFKSFDIDMGGVSTKIELEDLIDRDVHSIMNRYANEAGGEIALGKAGYPTINSAMTSAQKISDLKLRQDMEAVIGLISGRDVKGLTIGQRQFQESLKGLSFIAHMSLVTVAMMMEHVKILTTKNGFGLALNQMASKLSGTASKETALMHEIIDATGQATASLRHETSVKGIDEIGNTVDSSSAFNGRIGKVADAVVGTKAALSRTYGLLKYNDFLQSRAMWVNTQVLGDMINDGRKMNKFRMQQYGITPEILADFKKSGLLKKAKGGKVEKLDYDNMTKKQQEQYQNIMFRMNQNLTMETTLGGTGLYMHADPMLSSMSYLLTFPAEAFSNHGLRDIATMDSESFRSMFAMYMGGYLSLKTRYAIQGKDDVTDEEVAFRALAGMPIFGMFGTATGVSDPVIMNMLQSMTELIKISNYEKAVTDSE